MSDEDLTGTFREVEGEQPYLWRVGMIRKEDGTNTATIEVGDQYEIEPGTDPQQLVSQVGFKAVVVGMQLMGYSEQDRRMFCAMLLKMAGGDDDLG